MSGDSEDTEEATTGLIAEHTGGAGRAARQERWVGGLRFGVGVASRWSDLSRGPRMRCGHVIDGVARPERVE